MSCFASSRFISPVKFIKSPFHILLTETTSSVAYFIKHIIVFNFYGNINFTSRRSVLKTVGYNIVKNTFQSVLIN